jgi:hypothetical protein
LDDIVPHQFEIRLAQQAGDVGFLAREKIIDANNIVPVVNEALAQPGAEKARPTGHQNAFDVFRHECSQQRKARW